MGLYIHSYISLVYPDLSEKHARRDFSNLTWHGWKWVRATEYSIWDYQHYWGLRGSRFFIALIFKSNPKEFKRESGRWGGGILGFYSGLFEKNLNFCFTKIIHYGVVDFYCLTCPIQKCLSLDFRCFIRFIPEFNICKIPMSLIFKTLSCWKGYYSMYYDNYNILCCWPISSHKDSFLCTSSWSILYLSPLSLSILV